MHFQMRRERKEDKEKKEEDKDMHIKSASGGGMKVAGARMWVSLSSLVLLS